MKGSVSVPILEMYNKGNQAVNEGNLDIEILIVKYCEFSVIILLRLGGRTRDGRPKEM